MTDAQKIEALTIALWDALNQLTMARGVVAKFGPSIIGYHDQCAQFVRDTFCAVEDGAALPVLNKAAA